ncbi:hypothetical protein FRAHR75_640042 [Frankia sp. Hr75.2]|nr:hypothetical protein FRAHR75_640042 [Frankia sp. Hr75.2]SQD97702.1 hypothetical protein FMEAI12_4280008 [Parafrankia sp. Ea1.12]
MGYGSSQLVFRNAVAVRRCLNPFSTAPTCYGASWPEPAYNSNHHSRSPHEYNISKATHRVADQHVTGFAHFNDRVAVAGESGVLVDALTVAGKIDS